MIHIDKAKISIKFVRKPQELLDFNIFIQIKILQIHCFDWKVIPPLSVILQLYYGIKFLLSEEAGLSRVEKLLVF